MPRKAIIVIWLFLGTTVASGADPLTYDDPSPQVYRRSARASEIDSRAKEHPEIDFVFVSNGKIQDLQHAIVDTRVRPQGKLVIWLMSHNAELFDRLAGYGLHAIEPHYANRWFSKVCTEKPVGETCRGDVRLEAATGEDFSDRVTIPQPDGMVERSYQLVKWLAKNNPEGKWGYFLTEDGQGLRWEDVIVAGISHGSTTAARFAKHQKVGRVVMFSGPRDQYQTWQSLPSATPANRYFGFTHVLDTGWTGDHYCRSWELLGLHQYGELVDVDKTPPPFANTRRLITNFDVAEDAGRAHSGVVPGRAAGKGDDGKYLHEDVWRYLFLHPVEKVGNPVDLDPDCLKVHRIQ